jgi:hypothetical protein
MNAITILPLEIGDEDARLWEVSVNFPGGYKFFSDRDLEKAMHEAYKFASAKAA